MKPLFLIIAIAGICFACGCSERQHVAVESKKEKKYGFVITIKPTLLSDDWWTRGYAPFGSQHFNYNLNPQAGYTVQLTSDIGVHVIHYCLKDDVENRVNQCKQLIEQIKKVDSLNDSIIKTSQ